MGNSWKCPCRPVVQRSTRNLLSIFREPTIVPTWGPRLNKHKMKRNCEQQGNDLPKVGSLSSFLKLSLPIQGPGHEKPKIKRKFNYRKNDPFGPQIMLNSNFQFRTEQLMCFVYILIVYEEQLINSSIFDIPKISIVKGDFCLSLK